MFYFSFTDRVIVFLGMGDFSLQFSKSIDRSYMIINVLNLNKIFSGSRNLVDTATIAVSCIQKTVIH